MERILVINPGTTSTKIAVYDDSAALLRETVDHPQAELSRFHWVMDQLDYRRTCVEQALTRHGISLEALTCVVARGGMLPPCAAGAYAVTQDMVDYMFAQTVDVHISNVGCAVAQAIAIPLGIPAYIYDPVVVDELEPIARITGLPEIPKESRGHALNSRAMARRYAEETLKRPFADCTLIVQHIGGGGSTWLFHKGRAIDMYSDDDAGFFPTRCGRLQAMPLVRLCYSGKYTEREMAK